MLSRNNGDFVFLSGTAIDRVLNPVQIGSVLAKISKKVLATITQKFFQNVLIQLGSIIFTI